MKNKEMLYFTLACLGIIASIFLLCKLIMFMAIADDLSEEVTKLKQENIELKWELDQVDQMICTNEELQYEQN